MYVHFPPVEWIYHICSLFTTLDIINTYALTSHTVIAQNTEDFTVNYVVTGAKTIVSTEYKGVGEFTKHITAHCYASKP